MKIGSVVIFLSILAMLIYVMKPDDELAGAAINNYAPFDVSGDVFTMKANVTAEGSTESNSVYQTMTNYVLSFVPESLAGVLTTIWNISHLPEAMALLLGLPPIVGSAFKVILFLILTFAILAAWSGRDLI